MAKVSEREFTSLVAGWLNEINNRGQFPFEKATNEKKVKSEESYLYGDLVLYKTMADEEIWAYMEVKPPNGKQENLDSFREKAIAYNCKYAFTWNCKSIEAYQKLDGFLRPMASLATDTQMISLDDVKNGSIQARIKAELRMWLFSVEELYKTNRFYRITPDDTTFVQLFKETKQLLLPYFYSHFQKKINENEKPFEEFWVKQGNELYSLEDAIHTASLQHVYTLLVRLFFYKVIQNHFSDLPKLSTNAALENHLKNCFARARQKDWQAVFEPGFLDFYGIPSSCEQIFVDFIAGLEIYHFETLEQDVLGQLYEKIIDANERHSLGQYFTPEDVVDFTIALTVKSSEGYVGDPTCGSGTFLMRLYQWLNHLSRKLNHKEKLEKIWGFDIAPFPSMLATVNLFKNNVSDIDNFPRVKCIDCFEVKPDKVFLFPPAFGSEPEEVHLPKFSALVGNFPFIRQENIEKKVEGQKKRLTKILAINYLRTYPDLFEFKNGTKQALLDRFESEDFESLLVQTIEDGYLSLTLSSKSDLYSYLYIHCTNLIEEGGRLGFITSNSYLDTDFGKELKRFLLHHFAIEKIVGTWSEAWFEDASVNTVITILRKESKPEKRAENKTRFIKLLKPIKELLGNKGTQPFEEIERFRNLDRLVNELEKTQPGLEPLQCFENKSFRYREIQQNSPLLRPEENWLKYLRVPDIYFEYIQNKGFINIKDIGLVKRGITSGLNEFFHLEKSNEKIFDRNGNSIDIEDDYLFDMLKSPKECFTINLSNLSTKKKFFICNKTKNELKNSQHYGALSYIEKSEKLTKKDGTPYLKVTTFQNKELWYSHKLRGKPDFIFPAGYGDSFRIFLNNKNIIVDKRLYEFYVDNQYIQNKTGLANLLNSTLFFFEVEVNSPQNLGDGLLDITVEQFKDFLIPYYGINLEKLNFLDLDRAILPIEKELKQKDRIKLDNAILSAIGLDPEYYRPKIYSSFLELVNERTYLPQLRTTKKKKRIELGYETLKNEIIQKFDFDLKRIWPNSFVDDIPNNETAWDNFEGENIPNPGGDKLFLGQQFLGEIALINEKGKQIYATKNPDIALFLCVYTRIKGKSRLILPNDIAIQILLNSYSKHIEKLNKELNEELIRRNLSSKKANSLTKEILDSFNWLNISTFKTQKTIKSKKES